jgi:hypothetical protein
MAHETLEFAEFARRYCERHVNSPTRLAETLSQQVGLFHPDGWMLLECQDFSSSRFGHYVILPYGGQATFKEIPDRPISPRGLASDMSVVVAVLPADKLPSQGGGK